MSSKGSLLPLLLIAAAVAAVGACSKQDSGAGSSSAVTQGSGAPAKTGNLRITSYGPDSTKAGVAFNVQPGGGAALWIRLDRSLNGEQAAVDFNGTLLPGNVAGNLVTTGVPASLYAKPGTYSLHVVARNGAQSTQSNDVKFTVQ